MTSTTPLLSLESAAMLCRVDPRGRLGLLFRRQEEEEEHRAFVWNLKHLRRFLMRWDQEAVALRQPEAGGGGGSCGGGGE